MKRVFTFILVLGMQSMVFWSCEDPWLEEITINKTEEIVSLPPLLEGCEPLEQFNIVFTCCTEQQPAFPGGLDKLLNFIYSNLQYPANINHVEGTVYIGFTVEKDGTLSDFFIKRGLHPDLNAEAMRVVKLMPNWVSGKQNDRPVRFLYTMPVKFKLTE